MPEDRIEVIYGRPPKRPEVTPLVQISLPVETSQSIVFAGQVTEQKGIHFLVDSFRMIAEEFPQANLVIAGPISDWRGDDCTALCAIGRHWTMEWNRVDFVGHVDDMNGLLRRVVYWLHRPSAKSLLA